MQMRMMFIRNNARYFQNTTIACTVAATAIAVLSGLYFDVVRAAEPPRVNHALFATSDQCIACHSNTHAANGEDISIGWNWRATMMANSARDPYWQAAIKREISDHPGAQAAIEDTCATCHMPMAHFQAHATGG